MELLRVLIAEDHEPYRLGLKAKLDRIDDFSVVGAAKDGLEAVECACQLDPHVVLMDIEMPFIDGIEATLRIKNRFPSIRVIMLTAHENEDGIFAAFAAGADGYCLKGADIGRISSAIRTVADGAVWLDPGIASRVLKDSRSSRTTQQGFPGGAAGRMEWSPQLSEREKEVLRLVADGFSNPQIAKQLTVTPETVKSHLRRIMEKMLVDDRTHAAVKALRQGII